MRAGKLGFQDYGKRKSPHSKRQERGGSCFLTHMDPQTALLARHIPDWTPWSLPPGFCLHSDVLNKECVLIMHCPWFLLYVLPAPLPSSAALVLEDCLP